MEGKVKLVLSFNNKTNNMLCTCRYCNKSYLHYYDYINERFEGLSFNSVQYFTDCPYCDKVERLRIFTDTHHIEYI